MQCKNCGGELLEKATKYSPAQLKKPYYYRAFYYCPQCKKLYHDEKFKVMNVSLFSKTPTPVNIEKEKNTDEAADVDIWTDGACVYNGRPNARAAWAFVSGKTERAGLVDGKQTNNIAEALAIYYALEWAAEKGHKKIKIYSDSQISINNLKKAHYLIKANTEIFKKIFDIIKENKLEVIFVKVLGHSGDINNDRVDRLANTLATSAVK